MDRLAKSSGFLNPSPPRKATAERANQVYDLSLPSAFSEDVVKVRTQIDGRTLTI